MTANDEATDDLNRAAGRHRALRWLVAKPTLFLLCLMPFLWMLASVFMDSLGPDPAELLANETGEWAIRLLLATLAITPLAKFLKKPVINSYRRMLGLFSFFYACLHALVYGWLFVGFDFALILDDLEKRSYIIVGFIALFAMLPLAVTSTRRMRRRLGPGWKKLHRFIYLIVPLGVIHVYQQTRSDYGEVIVYALIFLFLILVRLKWQRRISIKY